MPAGGGGRDEKGEKGSVDDKGEGIAVSREIPLKANAEGEHTMGIMHGHSDVAREMHRVLRL